LKKFLADKNRCESLFASAQHGELAVNQIGQNSVFIFDFDVV
jgi:hypothetical protein